MKKNRVGADGDHRETGSADESMSTYLKIAMKALSLKQKSEQTDENSLNDSGQFWTTQPVPKMNEKVYSNEPIRIPKSTDEIRSTPYSIPDGFLWDTLNLNDPSVLEELYVLLKDNYVEQEDFGVKLNYQTDFLKWVLQPAGWKKEWHCGVRVAKSGRLVGFISAVPAEIRIYDHMQIIAEINYLCVHKKLRGKRVAPVLMNEIARRVGLTGVYQAVYTAGVKLHQPIATCPYWHRSLNTKKLIDIKFCDKTMLKTLRLHQLPNEPRTPGFRKMKPQDCEEARKLLNDYLQKFHLAPIFSENDFNHWFIPRAGIIDSFVVEGPAGVITDFVSYYTVPSTLSHPVHKTLTTAYAFYNVSKRTPWKELMRDVLIMAQSGGVDVFNALELMDNREFLEPLKFGIGEGSLQYYLYNWRCPSMAPRKIGLILQ